MRHLIQFCTVALLYSSLIGGTNIVLSNDDGWAELNIRTFYDALTSPPFGFNVVLSAPAENKSGTGSSDAPPTTLTSPCEFNTCPTGSPPTGFNASMPRFNYVNSFPVTSMRFGIQTVAPQFFSGPPDIAVAGPNVGLNAGSTTQISGTVGATTEAAKEGIPAIAFSGSSGSQVSYTSSLASNPYSLVYAALSAQLTNALLQGAAAFPGQAILPPNIWLNVNYSPSTTTACTAASQFKFVFTRINSAAAGDPPDVVTCNNGGRLPTENTVLGTKGCFATVSAGDATTKDDVDAATQQYALTRLSSILGCFP